MHAEMRVSKRRNCSSFPFLSKKSSLVIATGERFCAIRTDSYTTHEALHEEKCC